MAGRVHIEMTGGLSLTHDATIATCAVYKPLDAAYIVRLMPDNLLQKGEVVIPQYHGPGEYSFTETAEKPTYPHFAYRLIDLRGPGGPLLEEDSGSRVTLTVEAQGRSGLARFTGYHTPAGEAVSGTINWTCDALESVLF